MRCQVCNKREATIHLTEIEDGIRSEMHVCEICAVEKGLTVQSQMPINELLSSLLSAQPADEEFLSPAEKKVACPYCGFTLEQFRKEALLGCPQDYEVFEKSLLPLIERSHAGQTVHCGKIPAKVPESAKKQIELLSLRQQLEAAVRSEDYESAAKLRDRINRIEK